MQTINEPKFMELNGMMGSSLGSNFQSNINSQDNSLVHENSMLQPKLQHSSDSDDVNKLYEQANQRRMQQDTNLAPNNPYHPKPNKQQQQLLQQQHEQPQQQMNNNLQNQQVLPQTNKDINNLSSVSQNPFDSQDNSSLEDQFSLLSNKIDNNNSNGDNSNISMTDQDIQKEIMKRGLNAQVSYVKNPPQQKTHSHIPEKNNNDIMLVTQALQAKRNEPQYIEYDLSLNSDHRDKQYDITLSNEKINKRCYTNKFVFYINPNEDKESGCILNMPVIKNIAKIDINSMAMKLNL